ncbi:MAG: hypothetical protein A3G81_15440, partial [Betaproteobacteria bacterium RIFCSPLOWO2_12_FULL_65_14]
WFNSFRRSVVAIAAIGALLFAQVAIAAYACEMLAHTAMDDCMEIGGHDTPMCHAHCETHKQGLDQPKPHAVALMSAPILSLAYIVPERDRNVLSPARCPPATGSPPLAILHCSLQI